MSRTILLVEDDAGIAGMLGVALGRWGYRVLHAADCRSAVEIAKALRHEIDVVLCDVVLPDGPGPEALPLIRRSCPRSRIVFTSGYPFDVLTERGLISMELLQDWNAQYLPKPFLPADVRVLLAGAFPDAEIGRSASNCAFSFSRLEAYVGFAY